MLFIPVGFYYCLNHKVTYGKLFIGLYGVLATYFSCVMIRLMLVVAPAACVLAAIGVSEILRKMSRNIRYHWFKKSGAEPGKDQVEGEGKKKQDEGKKGGKDKKGDQKQNKKRRIPADVAVVVIFFMIYILSSYIFHSTYIAAEAYSSPSIILASRRNDGSRVIIDDFREAYYWLK